MGKNKITPFLLNRSSRLGQSGMTLVEVMITMGVASTMMLGVLQLITYANKSGKNVAVTSDWTNLVNSAQLALSNPDTCSKVVSGMTFVGTQLAPSQASPQTLEFPEGLQYKSISAPLDVGSPPSPPSGCTCPVSNFMSACFSKCVSYGLNKTAYDMQKSATSIANAAYQAQKPIQIIKVGIYNGFAVEKVYAIQNGPRKNIKWVTNGVLKNYYIYNMDLYLEGSKLNLGAGMSTPTATGTDTGTDTGTSTGTTSSIFVQGTGQSLTLGAQKLTTKQPVSFQLVVGPIDDVATAAIVTSCVLKDNVSSQACQDLGGTYNPSSPEGQKCLLNPLYLGTQSVSAPGINAGTGKTLMSGEVIQINGTKGSPSADDYALGKDDLTFWFNIGGDGSIPTSMPSALPNFLWHFSGAGKYNNGTSTPAIDADLMRLSTTINSKDVVSGAKHSQTELNVGVPFNTSTVENINNYSVLSFGSPLQSQGLNITQKISAPAIRSLENMNGTAPTNASIDNLSGLDFQTDGKNRLRITRDGTIHITKTDHDASNESFKDSYNLFFGYPAKMSPTVPGGSISVEPNPYATSAAAVAAANSSKMSFNLDGELAFRIDDAGVIRIPESSALSGSSILNFGFFKKDGSTPSFDTQIYACRSDTTAPCNSYSTLWGLDFYTGSQNRLSIAEDGLVNVRSGKFSIGVDNSGNPNLENVPHSCTRYSSSHGTNHGPGVGKFQTAQVQCPTDSVIMSANGKCWWLDNDTNLGGTAQEPQFVSIGTETTYAVNRGIQTCRQLTAGTGGPIEHFSAQITIVCCKDGYSPTVTCDKTKNNCTNMQGSP